MDVAPRIQVRLSASAVRHNLEQLQHHTPHSRIMAVIKSNAYGHGLLPMAQVLQGRVGALAVRDAAEARMLLEADVHEQPVCALEGGMTPEEWSVLNHPACWSVVHHPSQLQMLDQQHPVRPWAIWLKIDVGMGRLGFLPHEVPAVMDRIEQMPQVRLIGLMAQCSSADERDPSSTQRQQAAFVAVANAYPHLQRSLANSSALTHHPTCHLDWVRPGLALYGVAPEGPSHTHLALKPVMQVHSRLMSVRDLPPGATVGYGQTWRAPEKGARVGQVAMGFADGYPRHLHQGAHVFVQGKAAPLIGRISMDRMAIDLKAQPNAQVGEGVEILGPHVPAVVIATAAGTSTYEILAQIAPGESRVLEEERARAPCELGV